MFALQILVFHSFINFEGSIKILTQSTVLKEGREGKRERINPKHFPTFFFFLRGWGDMCLHSSSVFQITYPACY